MAKKNHAARYFPTTAQNSCYTQPSNGQSSYRSFEEGIIKERPSAKRGRCGGAGRAPAHLSRAPRSGAAAIVEREAESRSLPPRIHPRSQGARKRTPYNRRKHGTRGRGNSPLTVRKPGRHGSRRGNFGAAAAGGAGNFSLPVRAAIDFSLRHRQPQPAVRGGARTLFYPEGRGHQRRPALARFRATVISFSRQRNLQGIPGGRWNGIRFGIDRRRQSLWTADHEGKNRKARRPFRDRHSARQGHPDLHDRTHRVIQWEPG